MSQEPLPVDSSLFFKLVRVVNLTARPFHDKVGRQHHLTLNEWRVMVVLASHPGIAATDVAEHTGQDKMSISRALAGLQRHGRLDRKPDPTDQRKSRLYLSSVGRRLFARIGALAKVREAELFGDIPAADLEGMGVTLDRLIEAVRRADG